LAGCASRVTLEPDFCRAYNEAFGEQADLHRDGQPTPGIPLDGVEALGIRAQVAEQASDEATGEAVYVIPSD